MKHHILTSQSDITHIAYDPDKSHAYLKFKSGAAYRYEAVEPHHFDNTVTAKERNQAIGAETPGSEGSYLIHHIIGRRGTPPPYAYTKLTPDQTAEIWPQEVKP